MAVLRRVVLRRFVEVVLGVQVVAVRRMRVMRGLLVIAGFVMLRGFVVMRRRVAVMFGRLLRIIMNCLSYL